ncbi:MAG: hypothetical protein QXY45_03170 [Candidatus Aenigmatarchaeota archaeon]
MIEQIKKLKESSKKRNFKQRFDLVIVLKDIDLNKAENQIDELLTLPKPTGKSSIVLFADSINNLEGVRIISSEGIQKLAANKKEVKKLINDTTIFLAEPKLMPVVGKHLGKFLAPAGKMPKPIVGDLKKSIADYQNAIRIKTTKQPMIQLSIGVEDMNPADVTENINAVINFLKTKLSKGRNNISKIYLKLTMSKPIKLEGW